MCFANYFGQLKKYFIQFIDIFILKKNTRNRGRLSPTEPKTTAGGLFHVITVLLHCYLSFHQFGSKSPVSPVPNQDQMPTQTKTNLQHCHPSIEHQGWRGVSDSKVSYAVNGGARTYLQQQAGLPQRKLCGLVLQDVPPPVRLPHHVALELWVRPAARRLGAAGRKQLLQPAAVLSSGRLQLLQLQGAPCSPNHTSAHLRNETILAGGKAQDCVLSLLRFHLVSLQQWCGPSTNSRDWFLTNSSQDTMMCR